jgi:hypothetical protein
MKWYDIIPLAEFASPIKKMHGIGHSSVSRILKMAEIIQSIQIYTDEKVSGRHIKEIHFVSGVGKSQIEDIRTQHEEQADNAGQARWVSNMIYASLDPEKPVTTASIPIAQIPDNFNFEELMRWYISEVALNTGQDYQDLAPLPTSNIGSGQQSEILHRKSRGKGAANFMETWQNLMRDYGIVPKPYKFEFKFKDTSEEAELAKIKSEMAEYLGILVNNKILDPQAARNIAVSVDLFKKEDIDHMPEDFGLEDPEVRPDKNLLGQRGGNTMAEDTRRVGQGRINKAIDKLRNRGKSKD